MQRHGKLCKIKLSRVKFVLPVMFSPVMDTLMKKKNVTEIPIFYCIWGFFKGVSFYLKVNNRP